MGTLRDLRRDGHKVMMMHKRNEGEKGVAVGKTFTFPRSGDGYAVQENGSVRRVGGKNRRKKITIG